MTWHLNMSKGQKQDNRSNNHHVYKSHGLLETVILFLSFRHVEVPGHGLLDTLSCFCPLDMLRYQVMVYTHGAY
jgi:hypothetical protein